jgi:hypothetical protein
MSLQMLEATVKLSVKFLGHPSEPSFRFDLLIVLDPQSYLRTLFYDIARIGAEACTAFHRLEEQVNRLKVRSHASILCFV